MLHYLSLECEGNPPVKADASPLFVFGGVFNFKVYPEALRKRFYT